MKKNMDWSFWLPTIGGAVLTTIGVILATYSAINSHYESKADKLKADSIAARNTELLEQNNEKSINIINELSISSEKTRILLDQTSEVLKSQNKAGDLLTKQLKSLSVINNTVIESGDQLANTIKQVNTQLNDNMTGGDSYPVISIDNTGEGRFRLSGINKSEHLLPNVVITIENYSEIEKCDIKIIDGISRLNNECFKANSRTMPALQFNKNTFYFIGGDEFLDLHGNEKKLGITIRTPNNMFYMQIVYQVVSSTRVKFLYRMLKKINGIYQTIDINNKNYPELKTDGEWDQRFKIPPDYPVYSK